MTQLSPSILKLSILIIAVSLGGLLGLTGQDTLPPPKPGEKPVEYPGIHNLIHVTDKLYNGSSPEGVEGFQSLKKLGVKTILSVDGAQPDVEKAKKAGLRYVHMPIGYDGVTQEQAMKLAKAVRDLPGPIYIHCHHGKHRSPAASAAIVMCLDEQCTATKAIDIMKRAGTDPKYIGLYGAPNVLKKSAKADLDAIDVRFVESVVVPPMALSMVRIDQHWENLTLLKKSGWNAPKDHPDLDSPHEALQLLEHYRELSRQDDIKKRPDDFRRWLGEGESSARSLEAELRKTGSQIFNRTKVEEFFQSSKQSCAQCHAKYRDVPQTR